MTTGTADPRAPGPTPFDAVLLAGGRARRFGGADKPAAPVAGRPLLARVADAVGAASLLVVVGPDRPGLPGLPGRAETVREHPPGSGPVPALRTGLARVRAPRVAVLAADLPFLRATQVTALLDALRDASGAVLVDDAGRDQWLVGCWRTAPLRAALDVYAGGSLHGLLAPLDPVRVTAPADGPPPWLDCDTPAALRRADRLAADLAE